MHEDKLYSIALHCARLNDAGCALGCQQCQFNIFNYVDDVREASLLKANAYTDYHNHKEYEARRIAFYKQSERDSAIGTIISLIPLFLMVGLIWWGVASCRSCMQPKNPEQILTLNDSMQERQPLNDSTQEKQQLVIDAAVKKLLANPNEPTNVPYIMGVLELQGVRDVNKDGKVNCIDYSITFRNLYGSNAHLIINSKLNHMFIRIWLPEGGTMDVEPQGTMDRYSMGLIWGVKYDPYYNSDVTGQWTHVVGGM